MPLFRTEYVRYVPTEVNVFTSMISGLVPASGGGTDKFLRADGVWAVPVVSTALSDGDYGDITVSGSGTIFTLDPITVAKISDFAEAVEDIIGSKIVAGSNVTVSYNDTTGETTISASSGGITDGDKGDITVSSSGTVWNIDAGVVSTTELGGDITTAGKALLDDADASAQRTTLGLGTAATSNTGDFAAASHTHSASDITSGTKTSSFISDFTEAAQDAVGAMISSEFTYTDATPLLEINSISNTKISGLGTLATQNGTFSGTSSGTNTGDQTITLTGDVTGSGTGSFAATIASGTVTLAKMANMATSSILGRSTAGTGSPEVLSAATTKTVLSLNNVENTALSTWAGSTNLTTLGTISTGSWNATVIPLSKGGTGVALTDPNADRILFWDDSAGNMEWLTLGTNLSITGTTLNASGGGGGGGLSDADYGDITVSGTGTVMTIDNDVVTFAKMQNITTDRLLGRDTALSGDTEELTVGGGIEFTGSGGIQTSSFTGDVTKTAGGTSLTLATVNSNVGSFGSASQVGTFTVNAKGLITAASNASISIASSAITDFTEAAQDAIGAMIDTTLVYTDGTPLLSRAALTGDVTASAGSNSTTIANDAVTYAKMQNVSATDKLLGRATAGAGDVEEITCTAAGRALLDDADAAAQRTTLGLGTLATQSGTFSGTSSGTNTGDQNIFSTIAVSGQSDVVADSTSDTLTLVAGTNITLTTNASTDTITIAASGGGGSTDYGAPMYIIRGLF